VLPIQFSAYTQTKKAGEVLLPLEVTPEPRLSWQAVLSYRIDKAVDDKGNTLADRCNPTQSTDAMTTRILANGVVLQQMETSTYYGNGNTGLRQLPLKIESPKNGAKKLQELTGSITAQVQTAPEALLTVKDVVKSTGQSVRGTDGGALKVLEASESNGQLKVRVSIDTPNQIAGWNVRGRVFVKRVRVVAGGNVITETTGGNQATLLLQDAKGKNLPVNITQNSTMMNNGGIAQEMTLTCPVPADSDKTVKLVVHGPRIALVNVPFTLKDVILP
jgi:hypothetical protein